MSKSDVFAWVEENEGALQDVACRIWNNPELPFLEKYAAEIQANILEDAGMRVQRGLKDMSTALIAEYGVGRPIIGILGEYDGLANLSQKVTDKCEPVQPGSPGHGCGHNLLGTAGMGAVLAIKRAIDKGDISGTVRYYGCPAEETLAGKVFMVREEVFDDLDACLTWHPASMNVVWGCSTLAMNSVMFKFHGVASHAAAAPHLGRSALDGVELMNVGANYLREHVPEKARIHYSITNGGGAPNIVPAEAAVWYYIRAPKRDQVEEIFEQIINIARGAALMTGTEVEWEFLTGCYDVLPNEVLGDLLTKNMKEVGPPKYSDEERRFAAALANTFPLDQKEKVMKSYYAPPEVREMMLHEGIIKNIDKGEVMAGSTDVGDVSWIVPLAQFTAATWPVGTAAHTWQATASSGSGIGLKAMLFAAKSLAGTVYDLLGDGGDILKKAKEEFRMSAQNIQYKSPLPKGAKPPYHSKSDLRK